MTFALVSRGIKAPAARPHEGRNAANQLFGALRQLKLLRSPCLALMEAIDTRQGRSIEAAGFGVADRDPALGVSIASVTRVTHNVEDGCELNMDLYWPPPRSATEVIETVRTVLVRDLGSHEAGPEEINVQGAGTDPWRVSSEQPLAAAVREAWSVVEASSAGAPATDVPAGGQVGAIDLGAVFAEDPARAGAVNERLADDELERLIGLYAFAFARLGM